MKISTNKTVADAVSLFLLFAMAFSLVALPNASADTRHTYPYINAVPNPVGVGQEVLLHVGITHPLRSALQHWEGLTVTVTRPDGHTETLGPFRTDSTGGTGTIYVPTMAGNYTLQTHFPEQVLAEGPVTRVNPPTQSGTVMLASDSEILTLVVQEDPIPFYPAMPLPTEYWTRPIDAQLREWNVISGSWLSANRRSPRWVIGNDDAPETAHVLWTRQHTAGGLVGGTLGEDYHSPLTQQSFDIGDAYEGRFANRLIIDGKLYYTKYSSTDAASLDYNEIACVDLHTGEELWSKTFLDGQNIDLGQLMYWDTYDFHGVFDYLWVNIGSTWNAFDAYTGDWVYTMTDVPSGTTVYGPKGEILRYNINLNGAYMYLWNSTNIPQLYGSNYYLSMNWARWQPQGKNVSASGPLDVFIAPGNGQQYFGGDPYVPRTNPLNLTGYQWNVTIPTDLPGSVRAVFPLDKAVGSAYSNEEVTSWAISLEPGKEGQLLFKNTWNAPSEWAQGNLTVQFQTANEQIFLYWTTETRKFYAFSAETGDYLWETADSQHYLNFFGVTSERPAVIAYDKIFSSGTSGIVYCYDINTGELLWKYEAVDPYNEFQFNTDWWLFPLFVTDGKIYYAHTEHSPVDPRPRGGPFICLNVTNGDEIFRVDGMFRSTMWGGIAIIGDSIIATQDTYDQRVWAIGKGPSATTVTAPDMGVPLGKSVLVKGMVTDVSPGTEEYARTARFPNGVPAVSDESMSEWMLYVYKQFLRPTDAVGVEVVLSVLDPNNNVYEVGRTTSDSSGFFSVAFTPEVPGKYTVIASFKGSRAYYGSFAETAVNVEEAPTTTPVPTPTAAPLTDTYVMGFGIALIIILVAGIVVIILMLRKR